MGKRLDIPTVALRYAVTFGPRQSVFNPYTGIVSIFSTLLLNDVPAVIYEDGLQTRDFIFVRDIALANLLPALDDHDRGEATSHACRRGGQSEHATADNQHLWIAVQWLGDARQQPAAFVIGQLVGPDGMADSHRIQRRRRRDRAASATS